MKFCVSIVIGAFLLSTCSVQAKKEEDFEVKDSLIGDLHTKVLSNTKTGVEFLTK